MHTICLSWQECGRLQNVACRITSGLPLFLLVYRFCICLLLVNLLLWAVYRRTDNWKRTEALLYKVFQNIWKKVRKK